MYWYEIPAWPVSWYYTDEGNIPADDDAGHVPEGWELALDIM